MNDREELIQQQYESFYAAVEAYKQGDADRVVDWLRPPPELDTYGEQRTWMVGISLVAAGHAAAELIRLSAPMRSRYPKSTESFFSLSDAGDFEDQHMRTAAQVITCCANGNLDTASDLLQIAIGTPGSGEVPLHIIDVYCGMAEES